MKKIYLYINLTYNSQLPEIIKAKWPLENYLFINNKKYLHLPENELIGEYSVPNRDRKEFKCKTPYISTTNLPEILKLEKLDYDKEWIFFF